jgi:hypothetical protein
VSILPILPFGAREIAHGAFGVFWLAWERTFLAVWAPLLLHNFMAFSN